MVMVFSPQNAQVSSSNLNIPSRCYRQIQKLVEKLVRTHTNLVLRESLDDALRHLLPWDIEFVIDETVDEREEEPEV